LIHQKMIKSVFGYMSNHLLTKGHDWFILSMGTLPNSKLSIPPRQPHTGAVFISNLLTHKQNRATIQTHSTKVQYDQ
jgi:hypothetical protein